MIVNARNKRRMSPARELMTMPAMVPLLNGEGVALEMGKVKSVGVVAGDMVDVMPTRMGTEELVERVDTSER